MSLCIEDLGTITVWNLSLGTLAPRSVDLGTLAPTLDDLGIACFPFTLDDDPILALGPIWAMDALASIQGVGHLEEVTEALDLVGTNHADTPGTNPILYDATAFGDRGGLYATDRTLAKWLATSLNLSTLDDYTFIVAYRSRKANANFPGMFSIRDMPSGDNTAVEFYRTTTGVTFVANRGGALVTRSLAFANVLGAAAFQRQTLLQTTDSDPAVGSTTWVADRETTYTVSGDYSVTVPTTKMHIGMGYSANSFLDGWIGSIYVFDRRLSDAEKAVALGAIADRFPDYWRDALPQAFHHYSFKESLFESAVEDSSNGVDGARVNGVLARQPIGSDANPTGYDFDGVNDYVSLPIGTLDWVQTTMIFSLEAWILPDALTTASGIAGNYTGLSDSFLWDVIEITGTRYVRFIGTTNTGQVAGINIGGPAPQHIVSVGNGTSVEHFVDGSSIGSTACAAGTAGGGVTPTIGASLPASRLWNGKLNEVNFHKVALTQAQIRARGRLYRGDVGEKLITAFGANLKHLFMMEEANDATAFVDRITANTGTYVNGTAPGKYSPFRGTVSATLFDGVNDSAAFPTADFDLPIGASDSYTVFCAVHCATQVNARSIWGKLENIGGTFTGTYLVQSATGATFVARPSLKQASITLNMVDKPVLLVCRVDRTNSLVTLWGYDLDAGTVTTASTAIAGLIDQSNANDLEFSLMPSVFGGAAMNLSVWGAVDYAITADEAQWIADVLTWS